MGTRTPVLLVVSLLVSLTGLPAGGVLAGATGPPGATVTAHAVPADPANRGRILRYWALDRMVRAAAPEAGGRRPRRGAPVGAAAPSATSAGTEWPMGGAVGGTMGKVFFSMSGRDYVCSATTAVSANRDVVVTAGHCAMSNTGVWAENWIFVPGYRDDTGPHGAFTARRMFVPDRWAGSAEDDYDVAMVALATLDGEHAVDAVGAQRIGFDQPRGRQAYAFGYPAVGHYDGERLDYCSGRPHRDPKGLAGGQGLRCEMTQGSSGGAWLSGFDPATGTGVITSVSSFKYTGDGGTMYGPYFGAAVRRLYDQAQHA